MIDQSEILSRSKVQFITPFFGGAQLCCDFYQPRDKLDEFGAEKPLPATDKLNEFGAEKPIF